MELWGQKHSLGAAGPVNHLQDLALQDRPFNREGKLYFENGWLTKTDPGVTVVLPPFPKTSTTQCSAHLFR